MADDYVEQARKAVTERGTPILQSLSKYLGEKEYLVGYLTQADLELYHVLDFINTL